MSTLRTIVINTTRQQALRTVIVNRGPKGADGTGGGGSAGERRHAFASGTDYCGTAPAGSAENSAVWTISRLTIASAGTVTAATATNVKWTDRLTATYT